MFFEELRQSLAESSTSGYCIVVHSIGGGPLQMESALLDCVGPTVNEQRRHKLITILCMNAAVNAFERVLLISC